ncbi:MAG: PQQ-binding-like beta-propeller repeat protein [Candidatus Eisenbacteria bacterium]|uniref:PQQ-binding-like beta-propeller repeat protein n=1 Tax=Eiseniibacteriota bacterium TaxID=2212470 RepID=A0A948WAU1_UNCEI|nr:PQQ-binding-like beta-propeller repeat protein [Candidatus Eisenbacteria bacterium]MBU1949156.1 PQQ-binding-like beta-propeller repeat protein [Candidatus Eisenbacteria bacterium]MBU2689363.1 PQQ-binding-like beta-propeller repeat protein [Candidatus Eisenbacteria bacterium]
MDFLNAERLNKRRTAHRIKALLIAAAITFLFASPAPADWNTGVGGNGARDGYAPVTGPSIPEILWEGSRPAIVSQQAACDGTILVVSRITSFTIPTGAWIVAHDLNSGEELWAVQLPYDFPGTSWRSRLSAIRDGQVYATRAGNTNLDYLYALDENDGSILWQSEDLIDEGSTESLAFAPDGDLIAGNFSSLLRINHTDGATVWQTNRSTPTSNGAQATVYGDRVYLWEPSPYGPVVTAFDLANGDRLYSSDALSAGIIQQLGLMCGSDGTIYAPRSMNNPSTDYFVALTDTGAGFTEKWRYPICYLPFASFCVGPDGSVFTYSRDYEIVALDPDTGAELAVSDPIPHGTTFAARIAVDERGWIYLTNGGFEDGAVFAFNPGLTLAWSEPLVGVNVGGPVLADNGALVVCGTGTDVRAYRGPISAVGEPLASGPKLINLPNPFAGRTEIRFQLAQAGPVTLRILDVRGRLVRGLLEGAPAAAGENQSFWDGCLQAGRPAPAGVYFAALSTADGDQIRKLILRR